MNQSGYVPHRGALILVLGILSWVGLGIFVSPFAWVLGKADLREMDEDRMDPEGRTLTQVGMILGMIMTILTLIGIVVGILFFVGVVLLGAGAATVSVN